MLNRLRHAALVHIAAHGEDERGEILLAPNRTPSSVVPQGRDYLLTVEDVLKVRARAQLDVLSCCHSGCGVIKTSDGVCGLTRAFLVAGSRSVLAYGRRHCGRMKMRPFLSSWNISTTI